ncbi:MAG: DoxX family protein [Myxococcota bacterium]
MDELQRARLWLTRNADIGLELVRIWVGVGLFIKGAYFVASMDRLTWMVEEGLGIMPFANVFIAHYIAVAHLGFGLMLAAGLLTRASALAQVPILMGAVLLVHGAGGLNTEGQTLEFTLMVLFILVVLAVFGGGRLSADHFLRRVRGADELDGEQDEATRRRALSAENAR